MGRRGRDSLRVPPARSRAEGPLLRRVAEACELEAEASWTEPLEVGPIACAPPMARPKRPRLRGRDRDGRERHDGTPITDPLHEHDCADRRGFTQRARRAGRLVERPVIHLAERRVEEPVCDDGREQQAHCEERRSGVRIAATTTLPSRIPRGSLPTHPRGRLKMAASSAAGTISV